MTPTAHGPGATPPTGADCLSDQRLDAKVAGESLVGPELHHVESCERCRSRLALFEAARTSSAGNVARLVAAAAARQHPERRSLFRPVWLGAAGAAALAAAVVVLLRPPVTPDDGIRLKGASLRFVVQRDGVVSPGRTGDVVRAGDALRFVVTLGEPRYLLLVGLGARDEASAWFPYNGEASERLGAGVDQALPGSVVLDDAPGDETFVALFSATPLTFAEVRQAVAASRAEHPDGLTRLDGLPPGTEQQWVVLRRE